ncbi:hypothetical protein CPB84DRAFT_1800513 [Gymnopilus junonius]|uniref:VCBS repeat-containing protein n=1 Tax=Gymnopilus junonius TaxID=109634 RepID=A0A9P5N979_GYMJU|nr:hypothetical protein CPB84DRAFT_1800513 [Gymnopilus junonius]
MSKYNKKYVAPEGQYWGGNLVISDTPFWWKVDKDNVGYMLTMPDGKLSLTFITGIEEKLEKGNGQGGTSQPKKVVYGQNSLVPHNGQGKVDIIGFGAAGVVVWRQGSQTSDLLVTPNFGFNNEAGRWRVENHVRLLADTTGNGRLDIVGFSDAGVSISVSKGDNIFEEPNFVLAEFGYDAGWRVEKHLRFVADLRNTGRGDIIGFGDQGVFVSLNNGDSTFSPSKLAVADFGYEAGGWTPDVSLRFLADLNGNGLLDIIGFGRVVWASFNNGDGTFQPLKSVLADFSNGQAWYNDRHPRFVADLTGDGKPDLIGMKDDGVYVAFNNGDGTFNAAQKVVDNEFCYSKGWRVEKHPIFIADLTGDGRGDIVGFYDDGVYVAINNGDKTFNPAKRVLDKFSWKENWVIEKHPRFLVDTTGDGRADIVGIWDSDVYTLLVENFGDNRRGWAADKAVKYVASLYP